MFFGPSLKLFKVAGIPVAAHWSLLVAAVLMAVSYGGVVQGLSVGALLFGSVLLHELGHSLVAQRRRVPIAGIELHLFGGVAKMTEPPRSPRDEIAIAIAGPLVSLALAGLFIGLSFAFPAGPAWLAWIGGVNLMLGVFNLLPALPMDGGRVFRAFMAKRQGLVKGTRTAVTVSRVFAVALGVLGAFGNPWLIALAVLVWMMGSAELRQIKQHEVLRAHGFGDDHDAWARYQRAADRGRPLEPEILTAQEPVRRRPPHGDTPSEPPHPGREGNWQWRQRLARDAFGRWVVVTEPVYVYRW
jgi:Zn-dependent protease